MSGALAGLRVVDCSRLIAGGVLATILADHGTLDEMLRLFETTNLTASPVYDVADIAKDPHVVARGILIDVADAELGAVRMTAPTPRLAVTPAAIRWPGPALGGHNREVYAGVGIDEAELENLKREGII